MTDELKNTATASGLSVAGGSLIEVWHADPRHCEPTRQECEVFGYPNMTTCGETMYSNTHYLERYEAWGKLLTELRAGVQIEARSVKRLRTELRKAEERCATDAIKYVEAKRVFDSEDTEK
jgi:hypothetical protein